MTEPTSPYSPVSDGPVAAARPAAVDPAAAGRNPAGFAAFIVGAIAELLTVAVGLAYPFILRASIDAVAIVGMVSGGLALLGVVGGIVAVVLGLIGVTRRGAPKGFAGAGLALGAVLLVGGLTGLLQSVLYSVV